jgi:TonB family protein
VKRAFLISLGLHLALTAVVALGAAAGGTSGDIPVRVYSVDLVGLPGSAGALGAPMVERAARPTAPAAETETIRKHARSGVKVDKAPSNDPLAPKGEKRPARARKAPEPAAGGKASRGGSGVGAGKGGGGLKLDGEPFPFPGYLEELVRRVQAQWEPPAFGPPGLKATVYFSLLKDGTLGASRVEVGSGVVGFDRAALEAVHRAVPLPPLPDGFKGAQLGVHFDFED